MKKTLQPSSPRIRNRYFQEIFPKSCECLRAELTNSCHILKCFQKAMQPSPANSEDGFVKENKRIIKTNSPIPFLFTGTGVNGGEPIFPSAHRPKLIRVDTVREWMNARDSQEDHRETRGPAPCPFHSETNDFLSTQTRLSSQTRMGYAGWCTKRIHECQGFARGPQRDLGPRDGAVCGPAPQIRQDRARAVDETFHNHRNFGITRHTGGVRGRPPQ